MILVAVYKKNGQYFCSSACADNHKNGEACRNNGCNCHS
ncbi:hypothetical protein [Geminocystis sp.]